MSEEMAVSDNATGEDANVQETGTTAEIAAEAAAPPAELETEATPEQDENPEPVEDPNPDIQPDAIKNEPLPEDTLEIKIAVDFKEEPDLDDEEESEYKDEIIDKMDIEEHMVKDARGVKRRASDAFSDDDSGDVEFKGFEEVKFDSVTMEYSQVLERLEAEVSAARKDFTPVRQVMATPAAPTRASKRPRKDTDGSRPSSAQSSRSEEDNPSASPANRGRRTTVEMSSPLLRIPLERGWKRELVYRAALDHYSRRNADIYYYTPQGKKLRSTREVAEQLSGTGLTLENFSFFKEPLGIDDPEKEIIRDAKLMRRVESPASSPAPVTVDGKRTPKPKQPKGASPEPSMPKSPPAKLKVKSMGSRISTPSATKQQKKPAASPAPAPTPTPTPTPTTMPTPTPTPAPASTPDNNNMAAWKKPRAPPVGVPVPAVGVPGPAVGVAPPPVGAAPPAQPPRLLTPPPLQSRPQPQMTSPDAQVSRALAQQPCSLSCGGGVPSLSCRACLCLYHPACAGFKHPQTTNNFLCKNCRKSVSPPSSPPPLTHKSSGAGAPPRRAPAPPQPPPPAQDRRVLLRMKVSSGGADGERVWAVAPARAPAPRPPAPAPTPAPRTLPQSLVSINGRKFIVVPRPAPLPTQTQH